MRLESDYEALLGLLNKNKVRYCIAGAHAVAYYARPRFTKDLDIIIEPTVSNAKRLLAALKQFGFGSLKLAEKDFTVRGKVIQLGYEPVRIDILTSIEGVGFEQIWNNRKRVKFGKARVNLIGRRELIMNKRKVGRQQDLADVDELAKRGSSR